MFTNKTKCQETEWFRDLGKDVVVVPVDKRVFVGSAGWVLSACRQDPGTLRAQGSKTFPKPTIGMLSTLLYVVEHSYLGLDVIDPEKRITVERPTGKGRVVRRITMYVNVVLEKGTRQVGGLRFIFVNHDKLFDWDLAIENAMFARHKEMTAMRKKAPDAVSMPDYPYSADACNLYNNKMAYLQNVLYNFCKPIDDGLSEEDVTTALHDALNVAHSPARICRCLSLERSDLVFPLETGKLYVRDKFFSNAQARIDTRKAKRARPSRDSGDEEEADEDDDEDNGGGGGATLRRICARHGILFRVPQNFQGRVRFIAYDWSKCLAFVQNMQEKTGASANGDDPLPEADAELSRASQYDDDDDDENSGRSKDGARIDFINDFAAKNEQLKRIHGLSKKQLKERMLENYRVLCASDRQLPAGYQQVLKWFESQRQAHIKKGRTFSAMNVYHRRFTGNLSAFANEVVNFAYYMEMLFDTRVLHAEIVHQFINMLGVYRIHDGLRGHSLHLGEQQTGKSFVGKQVVELMIPGTAYAINDTSAQAFTTGDLDLDAMVVYMDEAGRALLDEGADGTGNPVLKSVLSDGSVTNIMCVVDQNTKMRTSVATKSKCHFLLMVNANGMKRKYPAPILSRLFVRTVPMRIRDSKLVTNKYSGDSATRKVFQDQYKHKLRMIQALVAKLELMILTKQLPDVDMRDGMLLYNKLKEQLAVHGITLGPRDDEKLQLFMRACVLFEAVTTVFCTDAVFANPKMEFQDAHLLECARLLYLRDEIVYFTLTSMSDMFIDPTLFAMCDVIRRITCDTVDRQTAYCPVRKTDAGIVYDYESYFINLDFGERDAVYDKFARMIVGKMRDRQVVVYSTQNVMDALMDMDVQRMEVFECNRAGPLPTAGPTHSRKVIESHMFQGKLGVRILRQYVDAKANSGNRVAFMTEIIRGARLPLSRDTCLLGYTYRDDECYVHASGSRPVMVPYAYHTIRARDFVQPDAAAVGPAVVVENPAYLPEDIALMPGDMARIVNDPARPKRAIDLRGVTRHGYQAFCHERGMLCVADRTKTLSETAPGKGVVFANYPNDMIAKHIAHQGPERDQRHIDRLVDLTHDVDDVKENRARPRPSPKARHKSAAAERGDSDDDDVLHIDTSTQHSYMSFAEPRSPPVQPSRHFSASQS